MRLLLTSSLVFVLAVSYCWGQSNEHAQVSAVSKSVVHLPKQDEHSGSTVEQQTAMSKIRSVDEAIRKKLNEPTTFHFDETPWNEIEQELEKSYGFNIVLTSSAKDDSLSDDEPFIENLTGIPLRHALRILLTKKNATYVIQDSVMKIISLDDAEDAKWFSTNFINVRPLLANISTLEKDRIGKPRITLAKQTKNAENKATELVSAESLLTDLIHSSHRPDEWCTGQGLATISIIGGYAVVRCNEEFADGLKDFLADLNFHLSQE